MWVLCENREFDIVNDLGDVVSSESRNAIKFVIMRGLNYGNRLAHGLLGKSIDTGGGRIGNTYQESAVF
jgi:hypothetical protein